LRLRVGPSDVFEAAAFSFQHTVFSPFQSDFEL
jgi:hypothetical protein